MIKDLKVIAIIPARGGSKRIPNKNIKILAGKPLIQYSIDEAKKSIYLDRLIVSTNSKEIADLSIGLGAEAPFIRPDEFASDNANDFVVIKHALDWLNENEHYVPDIIVQLRPTSPLRTADQIDRCIEALVSHNDIDSVRTVVEPEQSPYKMYRLDEYGFLKPLIEIDGTLESFNLPQAELPKVYKHIGYVDVVWVKTIIEKGMMTGHKIFPIVIDGGLSGINTLNDWKYYEYLIENKND